MSHEYVSTACFHGLHDSCRLYCKWCNNFCKCYCHDITETSEMTTEIGELEHGQP